MKHLFRTIIFLLIFSFCFIYCDNKPTEPEEILYGDINLDGRSNELADATLFMGYLKYGDTVFTDPRLQLKATDINHDGTYPEISDYYFLIFTIIGDPYLDSTPVPVYVEINIGTTIEIDKPMGAAYVVIKGNVAPELLAKDMRLEYNYDSKNSVTRTMIYSTNLIQPFSGAFLIPNGEVIDISFATNKGTKAIPLLNQH